MRDTFRIPFFAILTVKLTSIFWMSDAVLLYPESTVFQFTLGVSVPVSMRKRGSVVSTCGFQFNYALPWKLSQLEPTVILARNSRDLNLQDTYGAIEDFLNKHGWRDGRECLLRTICELAEVPLARTNQDVLEEMIHLILTPTEDLPGTFNSSHRSIEKFYQEAEELGNSGGDCDLAYPDCIESPLASFTDILFPQGVL